MRIFTTNSLCICLALLLWIASSSPPAAAESQLQVTVTIAPQAYLFDRIGGSALKTEILIPPGRSPATYEPSARQLVALGKTDIYCKVGHHAFSFEAKHVDPILRRHPQIEIIDMWALSLDKSRRDQSSRPGIEYREPHPTETSERHLKNKPNISTDPHIWLSPHQMSQTAREIEGLLSRLVPLQATTFRNNLEALARDIERLDAEIKNLLQPSVQRSFVVQHPAWGHFAAHYGLEQLAIERNGKEPSPRHLISLIDRARADEIRTILVQSNNSDRAARIVAKEIDARVVSLDPLAYDWLLGLRHTAQALKSGRQHG